MTSTAAANRAQRRRFVVVADRRRRRHLAGRAVLLTGQDVAAIAEPGGGERRHPAKLAAADQADGGVGRQRERSTAIRGEVEPARSAIAPSGVVGGPRRQRVEPQASSRRQRRSLVARIAAASNAALTAPARPIASVPTGTPAGICTIDSRLSIPLRLCDSTGTPSTGSGVQAAHMPGRCAAPPAPAMITFSPRSRAPRGILAQPVRRAMRRHDAGFVRHGQALQRLRGVAQRRPVRLAAHDDADEGGHQAMLSGISRLSSQAISSFSISLRFFSRCRCN